MRRGTGWKRRIRRRKEEQKKARTERRAKDVLEYFVEGDGGRRSRNDFGKRLQ